MTLLIDTQLLVWAAIDSPRLPEAAAKRIRDAGDSRTFSAVSVWEVAIKYTLARSAFDIEPRTFRRGLLENGYLELAITGFHGAYVANLPPVHRDPFDRLLVAQANIEGLTLLTADRTLTRYPGPIELVA